MRRIKLIIGEWNTQMATWITNHKIDMMRASIGIIYILFGLLKFFPNFSPAEELAGETIQLLTLGLLHGKTAMITLGILEVGIGIGLLFSFKLTWTIRIALWHMLCTFLPFILLPEFAFTAAPTSLSLVGQYILKNIIIIATLIAVYCDHRQNCMTSTSTQTSSSSLP